MSEVGVTANTHNSWEFCYAGKYLNETCEVKANFLKD